MTDTPKHAPGTFCWVDLGAHDPDAAKRFYTALFGWTTDDNRYGPGEGDVYTTYRLDGRSVAASYPMDPEQKAGGCRRPGSATWRWRTRTRARRGRRSSAPR